MKAKAIVLAYLTGLVFTGRSDWRMMTNEAVLVSGTVATIQPDPKGRAGRWHAIYNVPGREGELLQVHDRSLGTGQPPAIDSQVQLVHPKGHPEQAQPVALGKRALAYLVMFGLLIISLIVLFSHRSKVNSQES